MCKILLLHPRAHARGSVLLALLRGDGFEVEVGAATPAVLTRPPTSTPDIIVGECGLSQLAWLRTVAERHAAVRDALILVALPWCSTREQHRLERAQGLAVCAWRTHPASVLAGIRAWQNIAGAPQVSGTRTHAPHSVPMGQATMAQLRDLPFDEIKLPREFVSNLAADDCLRAIFDANLALAHRLGLRVVAEGVATAEDWHVVRTAGCDVAQGYFVGRPMPPHDVAAWRSEWQHRVTAGLAPTPVMSGAARGRGRRATASSTSPAMIQ